MKEDESLSSVGVVIIVSELVVTFTKKMNLSIDKPYCLERASFSVYHF